MPESEARRAWFDSLRTWLPVWTAILGGLWAAGTYIVQQDRIAHREAQVALVEAQRPFLEKQQELYFETARVTGAMGHTALDAKEWRPLEDRFYALYWGELSLVESKDVEARMIDVEAKVRAYKEHLDGSASALNKASLCLAHVMRRDIQTGWGLPPASEPLEGCD
jgi:hypothetical protein